MTKLLLSTLLIFSAAGTPNWSPQRTGVNARLRGISAVSFKTIWASGSNSTVLRSINGGFAWHTFAVTTDDLDFRDIDAVDEKTVYVLSIGNGSASRIYKTNNAGVMWELLFKNDDPKAFYDAMAFWDGLHGVVIGDSVDGQFCIMTTSNGRDWKRVPAGALPRALENEGAFAASGSNIALLGKADGWIATGGAAKSRVLHTTNGGQTWSIAETPIRSGASSGIFSIAFRDALHGIIVGGDYKLEKEAVDNAAVTIDGGATWKLIRGLSGFRSAVAYVPGTKWIVAVGPSGADFSEDDGVTWKPISGPGFDTLSFIPSLQKSSAIAFAAGADGTMARLDFNK